MPIEDRSQVTPLSREQLVEISEFHRGNWWHSIDLGQGVVTEGVKSAQLLATELTALQLPDLTGKDVLDIGAWDGYFSFACESLGAARVVALDHFVWSVDSQAQQSYLESCAQRGVPPEPYDQVPGLWHPDTLPGKARFDAARLALRSGVESVVADFMTADLQALGRFDVVLFLGVLYHLRNPIDALARLAKMTKGIALIETETVMVPRHSRATLWEFYGGAEFAGDPTNWWAPSVAGLTAACHAAGFNTVEVLGRRPALTLGRKARQLLAPHRVHRSRVVIRAGGA